MTCSVCKGGTELRFTHPVLGKYDVGYHYCHACGLLQTEAPYWLKEAYGSAVAPADTGLVQRNLLVSRTLAVLFHFMFDRRAKFVDLAGGHGLLTRLMRDYGFDFAWQDDYCENTLARGFEAVKGAAYEAATAIEVLEHIPDPVSFLRRAMEDWGTRTVVFSTELFKGLPPAPQDWWYYAFATGQHISFYQSRTLQRIADILGLRLHSHRSLHMVTERKLNPFLFRGMTGPLAGLLEKYVRKRMLSRTNSDHRSLTGGGSE